MRVLVTGANGQLGTDVVNELKNSEIDVLGVDVNDMDITKPEQVEEVLTTNSIDAVIHCAAFTAVDKAEEEKELCHLVNGIGTSNIATVCSKLNIKMLYLSTDYVFAGTGDMPFKPEDAKSPVNVYGETKLEGEEAVLELVKKHFIVRISWVFGKNGANFVKTMLRLSKQQDTVTVVCDQIGSPTYTKDLAKLLVSMIQTDKYGVYHATNEGFCSWYEFAKEIFDQAGANVTVVPVTSDTYKSKAKRPSNSRMSKEKLSVNGFERLPDWKDALTRYLKEIECYNPKNSKEEMV